MRFPFFGRRCEYCEQGRPTRYWTRYDGYGRCRLHVLGRDDDGFENTAICNGQSWFDRHPIIVAFGVLLVLIFVWAAVMDFVTRPAHAAYGTPQERAVCLPEFKRLCPSLTDGSPTALLWLCVRVNRSRFSRPCSAVLERHGF